MQHDVFSDQSGCALGDALALAGPAGRNLWAAAPPCVDPRPYPSKTSQAEAHPDLLLVPQVFRHLQPSPLALAPTQQDIMWLAGSVRFHEDRGLNDVGGIIFGASQSSQGFPDPQSSPPPSSSPSITPCFRPGRNSKPGEVSAKPKWLDQFNKTRS